MVQVTTKKSFARVRDELKVITSYYAALDVKYAYVLRLCILWQECLTGNELTWKELFRACFSKDTGLQKMLKLQMQLMERDDDAWWLEAIRFHFISCCCIFEIDYIFAFCIEIDYIFAFWIYCICILATVIVMEVATVMLLILSLWNKFFAF